MSCEQIHELLTESLSWEQDEEVRRHLNECCECSEFCKDLKLLADITADLQEELPVPPEFQANVFSGLSQRRNYVGVVTSVLVAFSMLVAGGFYWQINSESGEQEWDSIVSISVEDSSGEELEGGETQFFDVVVDESAEEEYILRLPSVIRIKHSDLHEESYVTNVSH